LTLFWFSSKFVPRITKSLGLLGKVLLNFTPRNNYARDLMYGNDIND